VSKWLKDKKSSVTQRSTSEIKQRKIPAKVLYYFSLIPILQRFLMTINIGKNMRWHSNDQADDGKLRHPTNGGA